jgi:hypothetical protein
LKFEDVSKIKLVSVRCQTNVILQVGIKINLQFIHLTNKQKKNRKSTQNNKTFDQKKLSNDIN